jgi:hypothetical protein
MSKMHEYIVTAPFVSIKAGQVVKLSEDQIKQRKSLVKEGKKGVCEVIADFHLKFGETFSTKDEINKKLVQSVEKKKEYDEKPIEEKIEKMSYHQRVKFAKEKTTIDKPGRLKSEDLEKAIIDFFEKPEEATEEEENANTIQE